MTCGALLATEDIVHSYPHCWRCKNPIIFRTTEQWFCSVDALKDDAVKACEDIKWIPGLGSGAHDLHDPRAFRLVHFPSACLGCSDSDLLPARSAASRL